MNTTILASIIALYLVGVVIFYRLFNKREFGERLYLSVIWPICLALIFIFVVVYAIGDYVVPFFKKLKKK